MDSPIFPTRRPDTVSRDGIWIFHKMEFGFVGLDADDLLVAVFPLRGSLPLVGRRPGALRLDYCSAVLVELDETRFTSNCGFITLVDRALERSYWALVRSISRSLAKFTSVTARDLGGAFSVWEMLFQSRRRLSADEEVGLWGELYFLLSCPDIDRAVACWRGPSAEDFDFLANDIVLEIKTSRKRGLHVLSHSQASSIGEQGVAYLVSIWVGEEAIAGISLPELVNRISAKVLDSVTFEERLLGARYSHGDSHLYDRKFSVLEDWSLYDVFFVPKVRAFDPGVLSLSYSVQLDSRQSVTSAERNAILKRAFGIGYA